MSEFSFDLNIFASSLMLGDLKEAPNLRGIHYNLNEERFKLF